MDIGHTCQRSLYESRAGWHGDGMTALRELRRDAGLSQCALAELLAVPVNTFRMWDSALRPTPNDVIIRAQTIVKLRRHRHELLSLHQLATEAGMHVRTLQAAARTGRLHVQFSSRSVFGRPMRWSTRAAVEEFKQKHYRRFAGQEPCPAPLVSVPADYAARLKNLRRRLHLSQGALALQIGAAGKAVIYQWESSKRTPSPVLWQKIEALESRPRCRCQKSLAD